MDTQVDDLVFHPKRHFGRPEEVLSHPSLSLADKRRILESWKLDSQRLSESTAENMCGGEESDLREVSKVLLELKAIEPAPRVIQPSHAANVASGMTIGALLGAAAGLVASAATVASLALVAQATAAGLIVGGVVSALRKPIPSPEPVSDGDVR